MVVRRRRDSTPRLEKVRVGLSEIADAGDRTGASRRPRRSGPGQPTSSACQAVSTLQCAELRHSSCATPNAPPAMACRCRSTPWDFERGCGERIRSGATCRGSTTSVSSAGARHGGNPAARRAARHRHRAQRWHRAGPARRQAGAADSLGKDDAETRRRTAVATGGARRSALRRCAYVERRSGEVRAAARRRRHQRGG
jgi:hypothetical protein